jgi:hypothetical protein
MSAEEAARVIAELRRENAKHRTDLKKFEDAQLTEQQRLEKRATEAEAAATAYQQRIAAYEVKLAAQRLGIIDPDLALLAIQSQLEYADDGTPKNADKLLEALAKAKPYLVAAPAQTPAQPAAGAGQRQPASSGGATNPGAAQSASTSDVTWAQYAAMSVTERTHPPTWAKITATLARNGGRFPGQP